MRMDGHRYAGKCDEHWMKTPVTQYRTPSISLCVGWVLFAMIARIELEYAKMITNMAVMEYI